jgi:hypothetical protein
MATPGALSRSGPYSPRVSREVEVAKVSSWGQGGPERYKQEAEAFGVRGFDGHPLSIFVKNGRSRGPPSHIKTLKRHLLQKT